MIAAEQIRRQLDIVGVVGAYVKLKRQGTGPHYGGLCPFHAEKTPSLAFRRTKFRTWDGPVNGIHVTD